MTHRTFDEQIANFNRVVSSWDINQEYKVALLGMIASLGYEHEKSITPEPHWIPVTERLPEKFDYYLVSGINSVWFARYESGQFLGILSGHALDTVIAWMPLPEPAKLEND